MNTDNMTISGETIDYGPCAFMDAYNPATVFSSIDYQGRYAYGNQSYIGGEISHDLQKHYCRFWMMIRTRRLKWQQKQLENLISSITRTGMRE